MSNNNITIERDWMDALIKAGLPISNPNSVSFTIPCPFHNDRRPSLYINLEYDFWQCYAFPEKCGKGTIRKLLSKYLGISLFEAEKMAITDNITFGDSCGFFSDLDYKYNTPFVKEILSEKKITYNDKEVPLWIVERGFDVKTLSNWRCGMDISGSMVIPIDDEDGRTVGWIKRRPANFFPKYLYSQGLQKSKLLFGLSNYYKKYYSNETKYLLTTEGPLDTMWLDKFQIPSVALLGLTLSDYQCNLLNNTNIRELVLCLDNDLAGKKSTEIIRKSKNLLRSFFITLIQLPDGYKDIQEIKDKNLLHDIIENRSLFGYDILNTR